jgi:hypothetical protein
MLVCERLLEHPTDDERFRLFASRVDHLHARVGTAQHAQVNDPSEAKKECEQMQRWWEMIWDLTNREMERQKKNYAKWATNIQS